MYTFQAQRYLRGWLHTLMGWKRKPQTGYENYCLKKYALKSAKRKMQEPRQISEKVYPVSAVWLIKPVLRSAPLVIFMLAVAFGLHNFRPNNVYFIVLFLALVQAIYPIALCANFHYLLEAKFLTVKQGVFSKQQRHVPYGVIQKHLLNKTSLTDCLAWPRFRLKTRRKGQGVLQNIVKQKDTRS